MSYDDPCPKCGLEQLRPWDELSDDEKEVVKRLPGALDYSAAERTTHRWCIRCWFESTDDTGTHA